MTTVRKYSALEILQLNTPENFERLEGTALGEKFKAIEARCLELMPSTMKREAPTMIVRQPLGPKKLSKKKTAPPVCCPEAGFKISLVSDILQKEMQKQARKKKNYLRRKRARMARQNKRDLEQERLKLASLSIAAGSSSDGGRTSPTHSSGVSSDGGRTASSSSDGKVETRGYKMPHVVVSLKVAELTKVERLPTSKELAKANGARRVSCT